MYDDKLIRYAWENSLEEYDLHEEMGYGAYKVFQPLSFESRTIIAGHLSDGGVAVVDYQMIEPKEQLKLSDWLKGVACAKQMVYTQLSENLAIVGYCSSDRDTLERSLEAGQ
jgi:hypothetical protein